MTRPVLDRGEDAGDLLLNLGQVAPGPVALGAGVGGRLVEGAVVFLDEGGDQLGVQQRLAQAGQDACLDLLALDGGTVGADALALVGGAAQP